MKPSSRSLLPRVVRALAVTAFAAAAVALAGCSISRPSPVKRTYLLEPALPAAVASPRPAALRVGMINVGAPYRGKSFVYRLDELKFEADFYSEFFVAPAALLSESTAKALTGRRVRAVIRQAADDGTSRRICHRFTDARDRRSPYVRPRSTSHRRTHWCPA
jgi:hypothetical protein